MTHQQVSDESPGGLLFPEYAALYDLIADEVRGLSGRAAGLGVGPAGVEPVEHQGGR